MDSADRKAKRDAYLAWAESLGDIGSGALAVGPAVSESSLRAARRELGGTRATEAAVYQRASELDHERSEQRRRGRAGTSKRR
jgi:hypothetical protein